MAVNIAVAYCGGCNPRFDRVAFASRLAANFPDVQLTIANQLTSTPSALLMICGCPAGCAKSSDDESLPFFRVTDAAQYPAAAEFLAALTENSL